MVIIVESKLPAKPFSSDAAEPAVEADDVADDHNYAIWEATEPDDGFNPTHTFTESNARAEKQIRRIQIRIDAIAAAGREDRPELVEMNQLDYAMLYPYKHLMIAEAVEHHRSLQELKRWRIANTVSLFFRP